MVDAAGKRLSAAKRPVIMAGNAVHWDQSYGEALELANLVDAPFFFNGMARSCFDVADPHVFSKSRREAFLEGDARPHRSAARLPTRLRQRVDHRAR